MDLKNRPTKIMRRFSADPSYDLAGEYRAHLLRHGGDPLKPLKTLKDWLEAPLLARMTAAKHVELTNPDFEILYSRNWGVIDSKNYECFDCGKKGVNNFLNDYPETGGDFRVIHCASCRSTNTGFNFKKYANSIEPRWLATFRHKKSEMEFQLLPGDLQTGAHPFLVSRHLLTHKDVRNLTGVTVENEIGAVPMDLFPDFNLARVKFICEHYNFRIPTELDWEIYAGFEYSFFFDNKTTRKKGFSALSRYVCQYADYIWFRDNCNAKRNIELHESFCRWNRYGLTDVFGNLTTLCEDDVARGGSYASDRHQIVNFEMFGDHLGVGNYSELGIRLIKDISPEWMKGSEYLKNSERCKRFKKEDFFFL